MACHQVDVVPGDFRQGVGDFRGVQAGFVYQLAEPPDFGGRPVLLGSDQLPDGFHDATAGAGVEPFQQNVPAGNASNDAPQRPRRQIPGLGGGAGAVHRNPPTGQPGQTVSHRIRPA